MSNINRILPPIPSLGSVIQQATTDPHPDVVVPTNTAPIMQQAADTTATAPSVINPVYDCNTQTIFKSRLTVDELHDKLAYYREVILEESTKMRGYSDAYYLLCDLKNGQGLAKTVPDFIDSALRCMFMTGCMDSDEMMNAVTDGYVESLRDIKKCADEAVEACTQISQFNSKQDPTERELNDLK